MVENVNTKDYWESRFFLKNWNKSGRKQTYEYARANVAQMNITPEFNGTILDFGCALGDALPVYSLRFPIAKLYGIDISENAVIECKKRFGSLAQFRTGDVEKVTFTNVIIASHVMEHFSNDREIVKKLLSKCNDLFLFVPFKENPLYHEHVNYYTEKYYDEFNVVEKKMFVVNYKSLLSTLSIIKNIIRFRFTFNYQFSKDIIMYHLKGENNPTDASN